MMELVKLDRLEQDLVNKQKERDASLVESKGCLGPTHCGVKIHDKRCPISLAEEIRNQP